MSFIVSSYIFPSINILFVRDLQEKENTIGRQSIKIYSSISRAMHPNFSILTLNIKTINLLLSFFVLFCHCLMLNTSTGNILTLRTKIWL